MFTIAVTNEDIPFVKLACHANEIPFIFAVLDDDETLSVSIDADESRKEEILKDIRCEKQSADFGGLPVYSYITLTNPEKFEKFKKFNGTESFMPLAEDSDIINKEIFCI